MEVWIGRSDGRTAAAVSAGASHGQPQEDLSAATERTTPQDAILARFWSSIPTRLPHFRFFRGTVRSDSPGRNSHKQNPSLSLSGKTISVTWRRVLAVLIKFDAYQTFLSSIWRQVPPGLMLKCRSRFCGSVGCGGFAFPFCFGAPFPVSVA